MIHLDAFDCPARAEDPEARFVAPMDAEALSCDACGELIMTYDYRKLLGSIKARPNGCRIVATQMRMRLPKPGERTPIRLAAAFWRFLNEAYAAIKAEEDLIQTRVAKTSEKRYGPVGGPRGEVIKFPGAVETDEQEDPPRL